MHNGEGRRSSSALDGRGAAAPGRSIRDFEVTSWAPARLSKTLDERKRIGEEIIEDGGELTGIGEGELVDGNSEHKSEEYG